MADAALLSALLPSKDIGSPVTLQKKRVAQEIRFAVNEKGEFVVHGIFVSSLRDNLGVIVGETARETLSIYDKDLSDDEKAAFASIATKLNDK